MALVIFNQFGGIRDDLFVTDEETIKALPDPVRDTLMMTCKAVGVRDEARAKLDAATTDVREKQNAYHAALAADHAANPPLSHVSELKRTIAANAGTKRKKVKVNQETRTALAAADLALAQARLAFVAATKELHALEAQASDKILAWMKIQAAPTAEENIRSHINASTAERKRRVEAGLSAETPKVQPKYQSELDRQFAARGKVANRLPVYHGPK